MSGFTSLATSSASRSTLALSDELINLGCPQIYTTNFDEVIETTYRALGQPVEVVSLSRDVARADPAQTQVVKYHGDLRHDATLVLTESQYWRRLDFESPMDLKFRSDLLGRSVMFIGYSFQDMNIRVIWFKLMQMMTDVPVADRLPSYMIRFEPNPVLEALYEAVGLQTIALDPTGTASTSEDRTRLLSEFLYTLASEASSDGLIPGSTSTRIFASDALLDAAEADLTSERAYLRATPTVGMLLRRQLPTSRVARAEAILENVVETRSGFLPPLVLWALDWAAEPMRTRLILQGLLTARDRRELLGHANIKWRDIWRQRIPNPDLDSILDFLNGELNAHERSRYFDDDLAYAFDLVARITKGALLSQDDDPETSALDERAQQLVERTISVYPSADKYTPPKAGPPAPSGIIREIGERADAAPEDEDDLF